MACHKRDGLAPLCDPHASTKSGTRIHPQIHGEETYTRGRGFNRETPELHNLY